MLNGEATRANFIVFGLFQPGLELTTYRIRREHTKHYLTGAVSEYRDVEQHFWSVKYISYFIHMCTYHTKIE